MCDFWSQCYEKFRLIFPKTPRIPQTHGATWTQIPRSRFCLLFQLFSNIYHFAATSFQSNSSYKPRTFTQSNTTSLILFLFAISLQTFASFVHTNPNQLPSNSRQNNISGPPSNPATTSATPPISESSQSTAAAAGKVS